MRIIRHELDIIDYQTVWLPNDGYLLSVAQSRTDPNTAIDLWSNDLEYGEGCPKGIYVVGTGNPMPERLRDSVRKRDFIGTVITPIGLVWHVFDGPVVQP
ncbi:DUF7352 domain-containing protein [Mycobacteroides abscessus]|uniref:DUF7352 domain-containing protein n=1 Tax=Mycobacteroides abscessus TaxID=36809 RepID=UPI0009260AF2|nr:hypothetical protein [Mycobacteroides abscessus]SIA69894.1 Uncharacterised protein [Mycobacteroides abscessus subsp. abscessus]